jgi:DNA mismatch repair protein MutS
MPRTIPVPHIAPRIISTRRRAGEGSLVTGWLRLDISSGAVTTRSDAARLAAARARGRAGAAVRRAERSADTPIRRQYTLLKQQHPGCLLLFQLGDFYESFEEDARTLARVCAVTLTSRELGKGDRVALAGVPLTRLEHYLARLVEAGVHVAIAEQTGAVGSGLVDRAVTRVVTPGTLAEPALLRERENNYLVAVARGRASIGLAYADVTTGEFGVTEVADEEALRFELERLAPSELLVPEGQEVAVATRRGGEGAGGGSFAALRMTGAEGEGTPARRAGVHVTVCQPWRFAEEAARERLCRQLGVLSLEAFGCDGMPLAIGAAGALLSYLEETNRRLLPSLARLRTYATGRTMPLDAQTRRNLELTRHGRSGRLDGSLLGVLDRTRTPMGGRLLRRWLGEPLLDIAEIEARLGAVAGLVEGDAVRVGARELLGRIGDVERQIGRAAQGVATAREVLALAEALRTAGAAIDLLRRSAPSGRLAEVAALDPCLDVADTVVNAVQIAEGRRIRPGYSSELDDLVDAVRRGRLWMASLESAERTRTGIRSLKVGYNRLFGYYIEVTRPNLPSVPPDYHRKQTLSGAERFATPELREREAQIVQADDRIDRLEQALYEDVLAGIAAHGPRLRRLALGLAELDVFAGLAELARLRGYCRPVVDHGETIEIVDGRHPVVEAGMEPGSYIPNDCRLSTAECQVAVLTGPNMAGKSTYLRQVALVVLMAQIGSFVPARSARVGLVDRIFTRVGAQDDIAAGASTFMVEMMETAAILRHATRRSLLVLDEIGRGTSTFDGLSIARAVVEDVHDRLGARTLFATHFHELAGLEGELARVWVFNAAVAEEAGELVFLRRIVPGGASRSFGIQVARLAGLPDGVTTRAAAILGQLEASAPRPNGADGHSRVATALRSLDLNVTTPIEALVKLADLRRMVGDG